jgi:hypothetical protein
VIENQLTSVSERIAKIFAIIVENPGLRQLSAIKPNFNSKQKKTPSIANRFLHISYQQYTQLHLYYYSMLEYSLNASEEKKHNIIKKKDLNFQSLLYYDIVIVERLLWHLNDNF